MRFILLFSCGENRGRAPDMARRISKLSSPSMALASIAALLISFAAPVACGGDEATSPDSPLGRFELAYASGVRVPATVKDVPSQQWMVYSGGWLVLRADSTYEMQIDGRLRDSDSPINGRHSGTFHWTRETGMIDLRASNGQSSEYRGTAAVDSVAVYCWFFPCAVPFPDQAPDFTFLRAR